MTETEPQQVQKLQSEDFSLSGMQQAGEMANWYAASNVFSDYTSRKARNTIEAQGYDLQTFAEYLEQLEVAHRPDPDRLQGDPSAWAGVTWGLIEGFTKWMLNRGFAISTVNRKLSTIKVYAKLAAKAEIIPPDELSLIRGVSSYSVTEGKRIDRIREETRVGDKKAIHVSLTYEQTQILKQHTDTPQGRRDSLLMCLLLDHGLRVGEVESLRVSDFDIQTELFTFYRAKVDTDQIHQMTPDTLLAVRAWFAYGDAPESGRLLRGSRKGGKLTHTGMSRRAIIARVRHLGKQIGIADLSPHDCRHYWATRAAQQGTDPFALRDAGGWKSIAMPSRYVEASKIANRRVKL